MVSETSVTAACSLSIEPVICSVMWGTESVRTTARSVTMRRLCAVREMFFSVESISDSFFFNISMRPFNPAGQVGDHGHRITAQKIGES